MLSFAKKIAWAWYEMYVCTWNKLKCGKTCMHVCSLFPKRFRREHISRENKTRPDSVLPKAFPQYTSGFFFRMCSKIGFREMLIH